MEIGLLWDKNVVFDFRHRIDAYYENGTLYFKSYYRAN